MIALGLGHGAGLHGFRGIGGRAGRERGLVGRQAIVGRGFGVGVQGRGDEHVEGDDGVAEWLGLVGPLAECERDGPGGSDAVAIFFEAERCLAQAIGSVQGETDL